MKNKTIINKGNYSFETLEREAMFHEYKGEGWSDEYKEYRKNWEEYPKKQFVSKYPLLVDIELASLCNLKCPMCYTISKEFKKKVNAKFMNFELFTKIVDEIAYDVPAIRLSLRGESTLHPKFIECIQYAKNKGIKEISFLTNGSKLDRENFIKMMQAGASWITVSFDGLREEYEKIRKPLKYEDTLYKIKEIKKIKEEFNSHKPVIKIQGIWPSIRNNPEEFYNTFEPYVDNIAFNPLIDFHKSPDDKVFIDDFHCPMLYQRVVIGADGLVMMCSNDEENTHVIGDANKESVYDIWHGEKLNQVRELHKKPCGYKELEVCKNCYLPVETENGERAIVNGREIIVLNYVYKKIGGEMLKNLKDNRCYIIAEIGGNFTTFEEAKKLVDLAHDTCVDAIKLQTYKADTIVTKTARFDLDNVGNMLQRDLFEKYQIDFELHKQVFDYIDSKGLDWFSTPSHRTDVDMLEELNVPAHKLGADDATNLPLIKYAASKNKPILLSSGYCTLQEVRDMINTCLEVGNDNIILFHTVSNYPTYPEQVNLKAMQTLKKEFPYLKIGFSDHTIGSTACFAAACMGAEVVEKHFTYDKNADGPDHQLSANPKEMKEIVDKIREFETMKGSGAKKPVGKEITNREKNRKSIVAIKPIKKGEVFTLENIDIKRPGHGIAPKYFEEILGKYAKEDIEEDAVLSWHQIN